MRPWQLILPACLIALVPIVGQAQDTQTQSTPAQFTADDPVTTTINISEESARWNLTETEYLRYLDLMKGPRGSFSVANITPIEVLGIHAKNQAEREKYAAAWVAMTKADTARVLLFQNTVNNVWKTNHPDEPLINRGRINELRLAGNSKYGPLKVGGEQPQVSLAGRTMFFTRTKCGVCDQQLDKLIAMLDAGQLSGIDVYVSGVSRDDDRAIQDWAQEQRLPIEHLETTAITLNHDIGVSATVATKLQRNVSFPFVVQRRGDAYELLAVSSR